MHRISVFEVYGTRRLLRLQAVCSLSCQGCLSPCCQSTTVQRWAARSLAGHIPSGSTASREPKPPRLAHTQSSQPLQPFVLRQPARLLQAQEETRRLGGLQCLQFRRMSSTVVTTFRVGVHVEPAPTDRAGPIFERTPVRTPARLHAVRSRARATACVLHTAAATPIVARSRPFHPRG